MTQVIFQAICIFTGSILFMLGALGAMDVPVQTSRYLTVLLEPLSDDPNVDFYYYIFLTFLGFWLTLNVFTRVSAAIALALVLGKAALVGDALHVNILLPATLIINLSVILFRMATNKTFMGNSVPETYTK